MSSTVWDTTDNTSNSSSKKSYVTPPEKKSKSRIHEPDTVPRFKRFTSTADTATIENDELKQNNTQDKKKAATKQTRKYNSISTPTATTSSSVNPTISDIAIVTNPDKYNASIEDTKKPAIKSNKKTISDSPSSTTTVPTNLAVATAASISTLPSLNVTSNVSNVVSAVAVAPAKKKMMTSFTLTDLNKTKKKINPKIPMLRAIVVGASSTNTVVVFRTERGDGVSCWCDKRLEDENKIDNGWCRNLGMLPGVLYYHINDQKVLLNGGFSVRLFTLIIQEPYNLSTIIARAQTICATLITRYSKDYHLITMDADNLLWSTQPTVWSNILGGLQAYEHLLSATNIVQPNVPQQGYFEQHENIIFNHFENGTFDRTLQALIYAPDTALHEDLLPPLTTTNTTGTNAINDTTETTHNEV